MNDAERLLLALLHCPGLGFRGRYAIVSRFRGAPPADFFGRAADWYRKEFGLAAAPAVWLSRCLPAAWGAPGFGAAPVRVITPFDEGGPGALAAVAELAPVAVALGNQNVLQCERTFAVLASGGATPQDVAFARRAAEVSVEQGFTIVAGHNRPVYQQALLSAKRQAAPSVVVLDRGLFQAFDNDLSRDPLAAGRIWGYSFDVERSVAISPYRPTDGWLAPNGRRRDQTVAGLAGRILFVALREGGTMHSIARDALAKGRDVWADEPSLVLLEPMGGRPWENG